MKYVIMALALFATHAAFAGGSAAGGFRGGGIAFDGSNSHRLVVVKIGAEYKPGVFYVDVRDQVTHEDFTMLLSSDQIIDEGLHQYVDARSNAI